MTLPKPVLFAVCLASCGSASTTPEQLVRFANNRCLGDSPVPLTMPAEGLAVLASGSPEPPAHIDLFVSMEGDHVLLGGRPVDDLADVVTLASGKTVSVTARPGVLASRVADVYGQLSERAEQVVLVGWSDEVLPTAVADLGSDERRSAVMAELAAVPPPERDAAMEALVRADLASCPAMVSWFETWTEGFACDQLDQLHTAAAGCSADFSLLTFAFPPAWPEGTRRMVFATPTTPLSTEGTWSDAASQVR